MKHRIIIRESALLLCILLAAWFLALWLTGSPGLNYVFDFNLHDTYVVFRGPVIIITALLILIAAIYVLRAMVFRFKQTFTNLGTLVILILLNIALSRLIDGISRMEIHLSGGWTIYPPLSALPKFRPASKESNPIHISSILLGVQAFFLLLLVVIAILTGKNWNLKNDKVLHS